VTDRSAASVAPPASPDPSALRMDPALRRLAAVVVLGAIMVILDTTIVSVAIDTLGRDFHTTLSTISWVTTAYLLALAVVVPLTGWAMERFGATRMWLISLTLFVAGSALCGAAWSAGSLIVFRALQGAGGGMVIPLCMALLARAAGPQRIGRVMSIVGVPMLIAPVLGPVIGGLIVTHLSWHWIFYVNVPIGAVALLLAWRVLPRDDRGSRGSQLDVPGLLLISPGLALLVYGLSEAGDKGGFGSARVQVMIAAGTVLIVGFVLQALRGSHPLLDMRLFTNRTFSFASVVCFVIGASMFGAMFLLPLYFQIVRGQSALDAGLMMAPQGLGAIISMPIAGRVTDRRGAGWVVSAGMLVLLLATIPFAKVGAHTSEVSLALGMLVRGIGLGLAMMPTMGAAYQTLDEAAIPRATTTLNILQRVGGSLGTALVAVVLQRGITHRLPGVHGGLGTVASGKLPHTATSAIAAAFAATYWWVIGMTVVGFVAALFLPRTSAVQTRPPSVTETVGETAEAAAGVELAVAAVSDDAPATRV
jgi:EmrB/QacA subfamily drug resistance transporter